MEDVPSLIAEGLSGWRMAGPGGFRHVSDDVIESFGGSGILWYAASEWGDFLLSVDWRITNADDNSGVFVRCPPLADEPKPAIQQGYEIQIDDRGFDPQTQTLGSPLHLTGAVYKLAPAACLRSRPVGQWNSFEILANGACIAVRLNGLEVSRLGNGMRRLSGHVGLQNHHQGSAVQFRSLHVKRLADGA